MNRSSGGETAIVAIGTSPVPACPCAAAGRAVTCDADSTWTAPLLPMKYRPVRAGGTGTIHW